MAFFDHITMAFAVSLEPMNLVLCFVGVFLGTMVGVLPGLGPTAVISLLLPLTFTMTPVQSIIMLAGIYYGAYYGGSTTSILVNIPGEAASVITCLDGYQMARQGRAGPALGISAFGSFIGGTFAILMLMLVAPPLARAALRFGPPENAALMFFGLTMATYLSSGSTLKALMMMAFGLLLGAIGKDPVSGTMRYTLDILELGEGLGIVPVVMGLFGISEVLINLEGKIREREIFKTKFKNLLPTKTDWKEAGWPIARGSVLGFSLGLLPGGGGIIASFLSYALEKKLSSNPETFGKGAIAGVAGPETANNSGAGGTFIPLLTLGIPCNAVLAMLMGALMIHGVTPGPLLLKDHPHLFWGVVGSMYVGNILLLVLNLPLIGLWVQILKIPYRYLFPLIILFCLIGAYSLNNSVSDIVIMGIFGIIGFLLKKFGYDAAPLILALVLGPMFEEAITQSLVFSAGSFSIFLSRPISLVLIVLSFVLLVYPCILKAFRKGRPSFLPPQAED
jgi:putative tricarboxylic transport membrane protein